MKQVIAYQSRDGILFLSEDECSDHEYNLDVNKQNSNIKLSPAENKVYELLFTQPTLGDIAKYLNVTLSNVKAHCSQIYSKHNVKNKTELFKKISGFSQYY